MAHQTGVVLTVVGFLKSGRLAKTCDLEGGGITLELEPDNPFDPHAVKVMLNGTHAAYVCRNDTPEAKAVLACGRPYTATVMQAYDASAKLVIRIVACSHEELLNHIQ